MSLTRQPATTASESCDSDGHRTKKISSSVHTGDLDLDSMTLLDFLHTAYFIHSQSSMDSVRLVLLKDYIRFRQGQQSSCEFSLASSPQDLNTRIVFHYIKYFDAAWRRRKCAWSWSAVWRTLSIAVRSAKTHKRAKNTHFTSHHKNPLHARLTAAKRSTPRRPVS